MVQSRATTREMDTESCRLGNRLSPKNGLARFYFESTYRSKPRAGASEGGPRAEVLAPGGVRPKACWAVPAVCTALGVGVTHVRVEARDRPGPPPPPFRELPGSTDPRVRLSSPALREQTPADGFGLEQSPRRSVSVSCVRGKLISLVVRPLGFLSASAQVPPSDSLCSHRT